MGQLTTAECCRMVKESISANILGAYAEVFAQVMMPEGTSAEVAATAGELARLPRFAINAMLMTKSDKALMAGVFDALGEGAVKTRAAWKL